MTPRTSWSPGSSPATPRGSRVQASRVVARYLREARSYGDPKVYLEAMARVLNLYRNDYEKIPLMRQGIRWMNENPEMVYPPPGDKLFEVVKELRRYGQGMYAVSLPRMYARMHEAGGGKVFLALLQQLSFTDKRLRKRIEKGGEFYGRTRVQKPKSDQGLDVFQKTFEQYEAQLKTIQEAIAKGVPHGAEGGEATKLPAGPFTVVNTGGFSDEDMETAVKLVTKATALLKQHGYGKVCYGDIYLSNTVGPPRWAAFYSTDKDEMFIRGNLKRKFDSALHTIIHELGHRYEYRFLKGNVTRDLYRAIDRQTEMSEEKLPWPKSGERVMQKGVVFEVVTTEYTGRSVQVKLKMTDGSPGVYKVPLQGYHQLTGKRNPAGKFVSQYARKDQHENFAEMVAHHCLGTLPQEQVDLLEAII